MSVARLDKDKDADENVDADKISTRRLVSGQPTCLSTQLEEIYFVFTVSGLPHAVVKQAENFRLQAELQQNNVYNPFSDNSKSDDS